jgi:hypothetical protein
MEDEVSESLGRPELTVIGKLGNGCQGEVYEVEQATTKQRFAVKVIRTTGLEARERQRAEFEVSSNMLIGQQVRSLYFPAMHTYWSSPSAINILFELCH